MISMIFKEDWEESKERFNAIWEHDIADQIIDKVEMWR
jgi:hypothetical protein